MHKYSHFVMVPLCKFKGFHCAHFRAKPGSKNAPNPEVYLANLASIW